MPCQLRILKINLSILTKKKEKTELKIKNTQIQIYIMKTQKIKQT